MVGSGMPRLITDSCFSPICFDVFDGVQVTSCGHSFWLVLALTILCFMFCVSHDCIQKCLSQSAECPVCKANLTTGFIMNKGFVPNFSC